MRAPVPVFFAVSLRRTACLALLVPLFSVAQPSPTFPAARADADAANPEAATAPLIYQSLAPQPLPDAMPSATAWRDAHDAVAAFPRGHADILQWEAKQGSAAGDPPLHHPMHMPAPSSLGGKP